MTLDEISTEVRGILRDPTVEASLTTWTNDIMLELATQFEIPLLRLRQPATLTTTTTDWLYDLSEATHVLGYEYHKRVWRITSSTQTTGFVLESDLQALDDADSTGYSTSHTDTGTSVQRVAVENGQLGIYPMASDTLNLFFYRKPWTVEDADDEPEVPDAGFHYSLLVPLLVLRGFRVYPELVSDNPNDNTRALTLWQSRKNSGLYGDGSSQGYIPWLQKQRGVHVRGPRLGSQLSGGATRRLW